MWRVPAGLDRAFACALRIRGAGESLGAPPQVPGGAGRRACARRRHGDLRSGGGRRRHVGAADPPTSGRARLRPGQGARGGGRAGARPAGAAAALAGRGERTAGQARCGGTAFRDAWCRSSFAGGVEVPARVLLVDDVLTTGATAAACAEALLRDGARRGEPARGRAGAPALGSTCLYSTGPYVRVVVARGPSPVVDASRGRNDPRKATFGR